MKQILFQKNEQFYPIRLLLSLSENHLIEVKDQASYVAVKRIIVPHVVKSLANERIKNKKVKIETAM